MFPKSPWVSNENRCRARLTNVSLRLSTLFLLQQCALKHTVPRAPPFLLFPPLPSPHSTSPYQLWSRNSETGRIFSHTWLKGHAVCENKSKKGRWEELAPAEAEPTQGEEVEGTDYSLEGSVWSWVGRNPVSNRKNGFLVGQHLQWGLRWPVWFKLAGRDHVSWRVGAVVLGWSWRTLKTLWCFLFPLLTRSSSQRCEGNLAPDGPNGGCFLAASVLGEWAHWRCCADVHRTIACGLSSECCSSEVLQLHDSPEGHQGTRPQMQKGACLHPREASEDQQSLHFLQEDVVPKWFWPFLLPEWDKIQDDSLSAHWWHHISCLQVPNFSHKGVCSCDLWWLRASWSPGICGITCHQHWVWGLLICPRAALVNLNCGYGVRPWMEGVGD